MTVAPPPMTTRDMHRARSMVLELAKGAEQRRGAAAGPPPDAGAVTALRTAWSGTARQQRPARGQSAAQTGAMSWQDSPLQSCSWRRSQLASGCLHGEEARSRPSAARISSSSAMLRPTRAYQRRHMPRRPRAGAVDAPLASFAQYTDVAKPTRSSGNTAVSVVPSSSSCSSCSSSSRQESSCTATSPACGRSALSSRFSLPSPSLPERAPKSLPGLSRSSPCGALSAACRAACSLSARFIRGVGDAGEAGSACCSRSGSHSAPAGDRGAPA
mmetsp:Transcript_111052/g.239231  ORF Transcript_111052/g.239231 Transcript_111052/m.239231 type:complete len:272 (+) Transcript_111052:1025-1840(+)